MAPPWPISQTSKYGIDPLVIAKKKLLLNKLIREKGEDMIFKDTSLRTTQTCIYLAFYQYNSLKSHHEGTIQTGTLVTPKKLQMKVSKGRPFLFCWTETAIAWIWAKASLISPYPPTHIHTHKPPSLDRCNRQEVINASSSRRQAPNL